MENPTAYLEFKMLQPQMKQYPTNAKEIKLCPEYREHIFATRL